MTLLVTDDFILTSPETNQLLSDAYKQTLKRVRHVLRGGLVSVSAEDITQDIILKEIQNGREANPGTTDDEFGRQILSLTFIHVRHRCYDELRKSLRESKATDGYRRAQQSSARNLQTGEGSAASQTVSRDLARKILADARFDLQDLEFIRRWIFEGRSLDELRDAEPNRNFRDKESPTTLSYALVVQRRNQILARMAQAMRKEERESEGH